MLANQCQIALKEWAITNQALSQGEQILLLRKGGIHESGKHFRVIHPEFLLYSTYEHQREDLLLEKHQPALRQLLAETPASDNITFSHWAKTEEILEISDQEKVDDLAPYFIWTKEYAQSRLRWKPMLPLSIMLLRVYQMEQPVTVPFLPEYKGCTSWVEVLTDVNLGQMRPVLRDQEFQSRVDAIKGSLGLPVAVS